MTRAQQAGLRVEDLPRPSLPTLVRRHKLDAVGAPGARALTSSDCAKEDEAMGVYSELRGFILAHRGCAGTRYANLDPFTPDGYQLDVKCGCGVEFKRWVEAKDADEDLLRTALLAFEN